MIARELVFVACIVVGCSSARSSHHDASTGDASAADASGDSSSPDSSTTIGTVAGTLSGLRWEMPCSGEVNTWNCTVTDPAAVTATLGGESGTTYQVTLRFRGVVEGKTYTGGTTVDRFDHGGTPAGDSFNVYALEVSEPSGIYHLNAGTSGTGNSFAIDYSATIAITAGATVTLTATAIDGVQHKNLDDVDAPIIVPGVDPAPVAYDGQFVQMDVTSVVVAP